MANYLEGLEFLENHFLPETFYSSKNKFITNLLKNRRIVFQVMSDVLNQAGCNNPFKQEEFLSHPSFLGRDYKAAGVFVINFPKPQTDDSYYRCIMIYDKNYSKAKYFVIGDGYDIDNHKNFTLYSIDKNGLRLAHKKIECEEEDLQVKECLELWKSF